MKSMILFFGIASTLVASPSLAQTATIPQIVQGGGVGNGGLGVMLPDGTRAMPDQYFQRTGRERFVIPTELRNELVGAGRVMAAEGATPNTEFGAQFIADAVLHENADYVLVDSIDPRCDAHTAEDYQIPAGARLIPVGCTRGWITELRRDFVRGLPVRMLVKLFLHEGAHRYRPLAQHDHILPFTSAVEVLLDIAEREQRGERPHLSESQQDAITGMPRLLGQLDIAPNGGHEIQAFAHQHRVAEWGGGWISHQQTWINPANIPYIDLFSRITGYIHSPDTSSAGLAEIINSKIVSGDLIEITRRVSVQNTHIEAPAIRGVSISANVTNSTIKVARCYLGGPVADSNIDVASAELRIAPSGRIQYSWIHSRDSFRHGIDIHGSILQSALSFRGIRGYPNYLFVGAGNSISRSELYQFQRIVLNQGPSSSSIPARIHEVHLVGFDLRNTPIRTDLFPSIELGAGAELTHWGAQIAAAADYWHDPRVSIPNPMESTAPPRLVDWLDLTPQESSRIYLDQNHPRFPMVSAYEEESDMESPKLNIPTGTRIDLMGENAPYFVILGNRNYPDRASFLQAMAR